MTYQLSNKWQKAAVIGSLWASLEIIIGSFFHNLRLPMAGTMLAVMGISLLIAFHQLWRENGLFWRAGLICALMKSISPSAIILGPMLGIFSEALLLEMVVFLIGRNLAAYLVGAVIAVLSALMHKIITLLIIFGFDLVQIAANLYDFAVKKLNIPDFEPVIVISLVVLIYVVLGIIAGVVGFVVGKRTVRRRDKLENGLSIQFKTGKRLFETDSQQRFSIPLLVVHVVAMAGGLFLINAEVYQLSIVLVLAYITFCILQYRRSAHHLKRPVFWLQLLAITLLAALFWNGFQKGSLLDREGLLVGLQMSIRAVWMVTGFSAISVELRNPLIKALLYRKGFAQVYMALSLAFAALPALMQSYARPRQLLRQPLSVLSVAVLQAEHLLQQFRQHAKKQAKVFIVSGEKHQGKTTFVRHVVSALQAKGQKVSGFLALAVNKNEERQAFVLYDLSSRQSMILCSREPQPNWTKTGRFYMNPAAFETGTELLKPSTTAQSDLIVIDEAGHLELKNGGWAKAIDHLLDESPVPMLWIVRKSLVRQIIAKWNVANYRVFNIAESSFEEVAQQIDNELKKEHAIRA